jgi:uncharacterized Tic20 family protein
MTDAAESIGPTTLPSAEARKWAMICHLSALVGLLGNGIGFVLGPLIVWLLKKEEDPFIDEQGKEAVNFQLTMMIAAIISGILMLILIGFLLITIVVAMMIIFPIIGGVKANAGEHYRYPLTIRFIK